jgi:hypothetical protein
METGRNGAPCLDANQTARRKGRSRTRKGTCPSTTEGVPVRLSGHPSPGARETDLHSRVLFSEWSRKTVRVNETGTSAVGIAVTATAPPARKARGVSVPTTRVRATGSSSRSERSQSASEPPRARPPKQATVNSRAHVSVWIQAARTALGLERPTPSRLMHDSLRSRDEREWIIVRSFYPASRWTSHPE